MLQVTTATTLMEHNIDEQMIMSQTGHRSVNAVRLYKRPSDQAQKTISDLLQPPKPTDEPQPVPDSEDGHSRVNVQARSQSASSTVTSSVQQSVEAVNTTMEGSNIGIQSQNANIQNATVLGNVQLPKDCSLNINAQTTPASGPCEKTSSDDNQQITINVMRGDKFISIQL